MLLALALLLGDAEPPVAPSPGLQVAWTEVASAFEVEDPSTAWSGYHWWWYYRVYAARGQWALLRDAPPAADLRRLPPRALAESWRASSRHARDCLLCRASMDGAVRDPLEAWLADDLPRHAAVESLAEAADDNLALTTRRAALARLRHLVGPAAYCRGEWPRPIPLHLLPRVP